MTPKQASQVRKMHKAGWSIGAIAKFLGEPRGEVERVIDGKPKPRPSRQRAKPRKRQTGDPTREQLRHAQYFLELVGEGCSRAVAREHFPLATDEMVALVRGQA